MAKIRVPRTGVTEAELAAVLRRRLGPHFQVAGGQAGTAHGGPAHGDTARQGNGTAGVVVRRSPLTAAVVRISAVPGATVFRVRGVGVPLLSLSMARTVADALRRSPEFRSI